MQNITLKFQTVAEKTANNFRRLVFFAAPGRSDDEISKPQ